MIDQEIIIKELNHDLTYTLALIIELMKREKND